MSQRSPMNARYQKGTEPKGQTRRSAASAKPKRDLGVTPGGKKSATSAGRAANSTAKSSIRERYAASIPADPTYKTYRRLWWTALGIALVTLVISLAMSMDPLLDMVGSTGATIAAALSYGALGLIAYAWYIDLRKIRPMMKAWTAMSTKERAAARAVFEQAEQASQISTTTKSESSNVNEQPTVNEDEESDQ